MSSASVKIKIKQFMFTGKCFVLFLSNLCIFGERMQLYAQWNCLNQFLEAMQSTTMDLYIYLMDTLKLLLTLMTMLWTDLFVDGSLMSDLSRTMFLIPKTKRNSTARVSNRKSDKRIVYSTCTMFFFLLCIHRLRCPFSWMHVQGF